MNRAVAAILGLVVVACVLTFALWPLGPRVPVVSPAISVAKGQESFARRLELGLLYERQGLLDKAQGEYEQAVGSEQSEIRASAQAGLGRTLARRQDRWLEMQSTVRTFLYWIGENVLRLIIIAAALWLIWLLVVRLPRRGGYLLLPFEDFTANGLAKGLHSLVNLALQQAKHTHLLSHGDVLNSSEQLEIPLFGTLSEDQGPLTGTLSVLDTFSVGGIALPLGKLLLAIRQWTSTREHIVVGSLHQHGVTLQLSAEVRQATTGDIVQGWELSSNADEQPASQIVALAESLAFRILFDIRPDLQARTWRSLQLFTVGLRESQRYGVEVTDQSCLEKAAELLTEAIVLDPGYAAAHYVLGGVYSNLGRYAEARDEFREVIASGRMLVVEATYNLGLAFYHEFQEWANDQAIARFTDVQEALAQEKQDGRWKLLLALAHCGLASAHAQRVGMVSRGKTDGSTDDPLALVERHCQIARELAGDRTEVQAATHNALGVAHLKAKRSEEAITDLKAAIQAHPGYVVAYIHLAEAYADAQPEEAIRWLRVAVRWRPGYEYAYFRLAKIHAQQGESEAAKEAYRQAPTIPDARNSLGEILAAEGEYEDALAEFHEAVRLNRRHPRAWGNLAWWTVEAGKHDEGVLEDATGWARRALELNRGTRYEWLSHDVLGRILLQRGRFVEAEQELQQSIEQRGDCIQNRYHLASLYHTCGDDQKAKEALAAALKLPDHSQWRDKAVALMQELSL